MQSSLGLKDGSKFDDIPPPNQAWRTIWTCRFCATNRRFTVRDKHLALWQHSDRGNPHITVIFYLSLVPSGWASPMAIRRERSILRWELFQAVLLHPRLVLPIIDRAASPLVIHPLLTECDVALVVPVASLLEVERSANTALSTSSFEDERLPLPLPKTACWIVVEPIWLLHRSSILVPAYCAVVTSWWSWAWCIQTGLASILSLLER